MMRMESGKLTGMNSDDNLRSSRWRRRRPPPSDYHLLLVRPSIFLLTSPLISNLQNSIRSSRKEKAAIARRDAARRAAAKQAEEEAKVPPDPEEGFEELVLEDGRVRMSEYVIQDDGTTTIKYSYVQPRERPAEEPDEEETPVLQPQPMAYPGQFMQMQPMAAYGVNVGVGVGGPYAYAPVPQYGMAPGAWPGQYPQAPQSPAPKRAKNRNVVQF